MDRKAFSFPITHRLPGLCDSAWFSLCQRLTVVGPEGSTNRQSGRCENLGDRRGFSGVFDMLLTRPPTAKLQSRRGVIVGVQSRWREPMPCRYCPRCGGEFQNWAQVCPDCNATLVDALPKHLPPEPKPSARSRQDPLVLVATAQSEPLAAMWAGILETRGIRSVVKSRDLRAAMYVPVPAFRERYSCSGFAVRKGERGIGAFPRRRAVVRSRERWETGIALAPTL